MSVQTFFVANKTSVRIALCSLAVGFLAFGWMYMRTQSQHLNLITLTGDASGYVDLAENLLNNHAFSFSHEAPFTPDSFRSPGYPLLLAGLYALTHHWLAVLLLQLLLVSSAPVLLYLLLKPYHERAARFAAYLFIIEPVRLFLASSLLSDAAFLCVLLLSLLFLDRGRRRPNFNLIVVSGFLLGTCILMRPIAMFLPALYVGFLALTLRPAARFFQAASIVVLTVAICTVPWLVRNYETFGTAQLSSVGAANLMIYNAPAYLAYRPDPRGQEIVRTFNEQQASRPPLEALSLAHSAEFTHDFREVIRGHELSYLFFHVLKTLPFFITDGLRDTIRLFNIDIGKMPNLSTALLTGNVRLVADYILHGGLPIALLLIGTGFWSLVTLLFGVFTVKTLLPRARDPFVLFCVALVLYFALLTGPVSNARYRLPAEGFLLFAACSVILRKNESQIA